MIFLQLNQLKPGMKVARTIRYGSNNIVLLTSNQILTEVIIKSLERYDLPGIYIESDFCDDVYEEPIIEPEKKMKMLKTVTKDFNSFFMSHDLSATTINSFVNTANEIIKVLASKNDCMVNILEMKNYDNYLYNHSLNVSILAVMLGRQCDISGDDLKDIALSALLHDIGKLSIPKSILNKPSKLTDSEFSIIKQHPSRAFEVLRRSYTIPFVVISGVETHHEKYDGSGYPFHLASDNIPFLGRLLAICDVYDALTSSRVYRKAWPPDRVVKYMIDALGKHFDPDILNKFLRTVTAYPVGTVVKLSNDMIGVVVKNCQDYILRPDVRIITPLKYKGMTVSLSQSIEMADVNILDTVKDISELPEDLYTKK